MTPLIRKAVMRFHVYLLLLLAAFLVPDAETTTVRYRSGFLQGDSLESNLSLMVAAAREHCMRNANCVSFSFESPSTRFPPGNVTASFYPHADWHVPATTTSIGEVASFVEDDSWHSYVNVTREREAVPREAEAVLRRMKAPSKLRGGGSQRAMMGTKLMLLDRIFNIVLPKEHKALAAPVIVPHLVELAASSAEDDAVRLAAMKVLIVIADTPETGPVLFDAGVVQAMKRVIRENRSRSATEGGLVWDENSKTALDVISNICLHRSVKAKLKEAGVHTFLQGIISEPGFPGLQAAMALTHIGVDVELPLPKVTALVQLLRNAIDGEIAYDIQWDLIPGPLSALKFLVQHGKSAGMREEVLDAGAMEHLLVILEADCLVASDAEAALEIMLSLSLVSERARDAVLLAEHTLREAESRLKEYGAAARLASELGAAVARYDNTRAEL